MSMNQFMHPRNIYKLPPNFKQLAIEFPEFRKHVTQDLSGKVSIDFKNVETLRALTCTLLKKDFGIVLELPIDRLIPTVPLRLNYILWIEDLVNLIERTGNVKGIDIGTGASCIYPLLAAKKNNWEMIGTEIDQLSIKFARDNVNNNSLQDLITVYDTSGDTLLQKVCEKYDQCYDFCMCNPPFFASTKELVPCFKARKLDRPKPKNAFCASTDEVVAKGGEVEYISRLINESKCIGKKIKIYTTMVGHKSSLPPLKKLLREVEVASFKQTEFCQGHTTRWGLAWTFCDIDLRKIPGTLLAAKQQSPKPLYHEIKEGKDLKDVYDKLIEIFKDLQIEYYELKHIKNYVEFSFIAYSNTWSNQRRKRREKLKMIEEGGTSITDNSGSIELCDGNSNSTTSSNGSSIHETCNLISEMDFNEQNTKKRSLEENENEFYNKAKKVRVNLIESTGIFLKADVCLAQDVGSSSVVLKLTFVEGTGSKEALHQVLQYIKNNLKL